MQLPGRGAIHSEEAYALGKMLDHSSWQQGEKIVRLVTPSDIDACWDNNGSIIFGEYSSQVETWQQIVRGQRRLYESAIKNSPHCAALCKHSVRPEERRQINSKTDVNSFQVMLYDFGFILTEVMDGGRWPTFVEWWFKDPLRLRRTLIRSYVDRRGVVP